MSMAELRLTPALLAEMIGLIDADTISGKIAKQILPDLLAVRALISPPRWPGVTRLPSNSSQDAELR